MVAVPKLRATSTERHGTAPFEVYKCIIADVDKTRPLLWHGTGLLKSRCNLSSAMNAMMVGIT